MTTLLPDNAIELRGLTKRYGKRGDKAALDAIDLDIPRGSVFGLLGPNGAGKSTLINILAGLVTKTAGRATVWGVDIDTNPRQARACIGVVPQELNIDAFFTPREILDLQAGLYAVPKTERRTVEILDLVGLGEQADAYSRTLSGGMRRRLLVAKAMVHDPPILVLDEPTAGVDVELRQRLWENVRGLNDRGITVLLTTHYLEEAEGLCDRIAIINRGKVIACEDKDALVGRIDAKELHVQLEEPVGAAGTPLPDSLAPFGAEVIAPHRIRLTYRPSRTRISVVLGAIQAAGWHIVDLTTVESDLEDVFIQLTRACEDERDDQLDDNRGDQQDHAA